MTLRLLTKLGARVGAGRAHLSDGHITRPIWVICAPYCSGAEEIAAEILAQGVASRQMPEDLHALHAMASRLFEANACVQRHLGPEAFLLRHTERVRRALAPLLPRIAAHDLFVHGPVGQTAMHPYVIKAIAPEARLIWITRDKLDWLAEIEALERAHPERYPEHVGWEVDPEGRAALLARRRQVERRKFLRLAQVLPESCLDLTLEDPDLATHLADFIHFDG